MTRIAGAQRQSEDAGFVEIRSNIYCTIRHQYHWLPARVDSFCLVEQRKVVRHNRGIYWGENTACAPAQSGYLDVAFQKSKPTKTKVFSTSNSLPRFNEGFFLARDSFLQLRSLLYRLLWEHNIPMQRYFPPPQSPYVERSSRGTSHSRDWLTTSANTSIQQRPDPALQSSILGIHLGGRSWEECMISALLHTEQIRTLLSIQVLFFLGIFLDPRRMTCLLGEECSSSYYYFQDM